MSIKEEQSGSSSDNNFFRRQKQFPTIVNGKINTQDFIESVTGIVNLIEKLGAVFTPVKFDMNGNIEKILRCYEIDKQKNSTIHDLLLAEMSEGTNTAADALLWLTRALHFIELFLFKLLERAGDNVADSVKYELMHAYELTLKRHHNWMAQKLFKLICQMCPTKAQLYKSMEMSDIKVFVQDAMIYLECLKINRIEIQSFYRVHNLFPDSE